MIDHLISIDVEIKWEDIVDQPSGQEAEEEGDSDPEDGDDIFELEGMSALEIAKHNGEGAGLADAHQEAAAGHGAEAQVRKRRADMEPGGGDYFGCGHGGDGKREVKRQGRCPVVSGDGCTDISLWHQTSQPPLHLDCRPHPVSDYMSPVPPMPRFPAQPLLLF